MKKSIAALIIAGTTVAGVSIPITTAAEAKADCNDTSWTWPLCHVSAPKIPHINMGGPRPDLAPKDSAWCSSNMVDVGVQGAHWMLQDQTRHAIRFWPDYVTNHFVAWAFDRNRNLWMPHPEVSQDVNCDA